MKIREVLGPGVPLEAEDTLDMVITERFQKIANKRSDQEKAEISEKYSKIEELANAYYSENPEECKEFLDKLVFCDSWVQEDFYLHGLADGIRIMKMIMMQ